MEIILRSPLNWILAAILLDIAAVSGWRGTRRLLRGLDGRADASAPLGLVYGIRGLIITAATLVLMAGILLANKWLLVFGAIFLLEELYETGFVILALKLDSKRRGLSTSEGASGERPPERPPRRETPRDAEFRFGSRPGR